MRMTPAEFKKAMLSEENSRIYHIKKYIATELVKPQTKTEQIIKRILEAELFTREQNVQSLNNLHAGNEPLDFGEKNKQWSGDTREY
jgi:hypothetical protein